MINKSISFGTKDVNIAQGDGTIACYIPEPSQVPCQLPLPNDCFVGREEELALLFESLRPGKIITICGPGGIGKSALAAQAVHKLEESRFPDGIISHSFYHQPEIAHALKHIAQSLNIEPEPTLETAVLLALAGRKMLLILDGTEEADDLPTMLRLGGTCGVLITSRKRSDALGFRLDLTPLYEQEAAEAFRKYSGEVDDDASVQGICNILGGWPVALQLAGRYLRSTGESAADYLHWIEREPLKELGSGSHQEENAALLLRRSVAQVSDDARLALGAAGCLAFAPIASEPVGAIFECDERRGRKALNELVNYGMMERKEERWQISHALIHTYSRTELALSKESLERLAAYYIYFCEEQSQAGLEGYACLDKERAHCLRLTESCLNSRLLDEVQALVRAIIIYLDRQGYWTEKLTIVSMRLNAARLKEERRDESWCLNELGETCWKLGEYARALEYYEQSLLIHREWGYRQGESLTLNNIGLIYDIQCNYEQALQCYTQSLMMQREAGDRVGEGTTLNNMAMVYMKIGDYETALTYLQQSLPISMESSDRIGESAALTNIAAIYRTQGNRSSALEYLKQGLAIRRELGDRAGEAQSCWNLGRTYEDMGDLAKAEEYISQAVRIEEEIGHPKLEEWREGLAQVRAKRQGAKEA
ncbi:tetratricopeptide repeat protein [Candidatus Electrothrix sp.]|uniref:tetratricopeptide repeat protein n=1 Tax=Candidatus Electrothrix sp. TaxID=2170559 RepID=UPI0040568C6E